VATRTFPAVEDPHTRVAAVVERHGPLLLRIAREHSLCADDAQDAYQRALEIYLWRVQSLDPATEVLWLKVVVNRTFVTPPCSGCGHLECGQISRQVGVERVAVVLRDAVTLFEGQPSPTPPRSLGHRSRVASSGAAES